MLALVGTIRDGVGMYLRRTQRRNRDGSTVRYVALAHNRRVEGTTRAEVLVNLGREDHLDSDGLRRLVASINRYLGEATSGADSHEAGVLVADGLSLVESRPLGTAWLLDGLWGSLGVDTALAEVLGRRRFSTDVERVLFAMVANRAIDPCSKLACAEWASHDVAITGLGGMTDDQAYRAMDLLVDADATAQVQEAVFFSVADLLNLEVDLLFFDTTSTYFESDVDDGEGGFRRYGHSKDHRGDLPQIVIGLAVTREGIPVRVWCWPGNTNDNSILPQVKDDLRGWRLGRVVTVVDRGFSSDANLAYLQRAGGHYIAGERMRDGSPDAAAALARQGRYRSVRDNLRVKEVRLGAEDTIRWIVCHNPDEATRDKAQREAQVARLETELAEIATARNRDKNKHTKNKDRAAKAEEAHRRAECALVDHRTLGRYLRQSSTGRLSIDRAAVRAEERLDGKYLLSTSDPDLSAEDVALGYKNLLEAERGFRDLKSTLELRPVFHRLEHRITAHVLICWLSLLLIRVAERRCGTTWARIRTELGRIHAVTLSGSAGTVVHTTPPSETAASYLTACGIRPIPRVTHLDPT